MCLNEPSAIDSVFLPFPKISHMLKSNAQRDGTKRWSLWDVLWSWGWSPQNGISAFIKKTPQSFLGPSAMGSDSEKMAVSEEVGFH